MASGSDKAIIAAFFANLGIAVAKFVGFAFTGAASMLAEAVHSVADTSNQGLLLMGGRLAKREASKAHPFGYGRERYFWSFVVALVIFSLGALFAIYEGVHKLGHPQPVENPWWAIGILTLGVLLEGYSFRTAAVEADRLRGEAGWLDFLRHAKVPELPVVLLEDLGALIGLVVALAGVLAAMVTGDGRFDAMGSLTIGVLLGVIAVFLAVEMRSLLLGESAAPAIRDELEACMAADEVVCRVIHMRTQHLGPDELLVAAKLELSADLDFAGVAEAIDRVEGAMRAAVPMARIIYLEPDVFREASG